MNREKEFDSFKEDFEEISKSDAKSSMFAHLVSKLYAESFLVQAKNEDKRDYDDAIRYFDVLAEYFLLGGFVLNRDQNNRIIYLRSEENRHVLSLKLLDTVVLLCLRILLFKKSKEESWSISTIITLKELKTEILDSKIYKESNTKGSKVLKPSDLKETLKKLKKLKCINFRGDIDEGSTEIEIYDTVRIIVQGKTLEELMERIKEYKGVDYEEIDEDQAD